MTDLSNKTKSDLRYVLEYCGDADLKNRAGTQLISQQATNEDLRYVLRWCGDADLKNRALTQLISQQATNEDLAHAICFAPGTIPVAHPLLLKQLGIDVPVDEVALIKEIAENVLARPGSLEMASWHCGTSHCMSGWACVLNKTAENIERSSSTFIAGAAVIPNYAQHFFKSNNEALEIFKTVLAL